jgi:acyl-CoA hydrolase
MNNITPIKQYRLVFPKDLNNSNTLFGGEAVKWMDETAYISASKATKKRVVTASIKKVKFLCPIFINSIVEISAQVLEIYSHKVEVHVEAFVEDVYSNNKEKAIDACFVFAFVDEKGKMVRV